MSEVTCFRIYTLKEVADMLKIHQETVKLYIKAGKIKKIAASGAVRIEHTELEKFIRGVE